MIDGRDVSARDPRPGRDRPRCRSSPRIPRSARCSSRSSGRGSPRTAAGSSRAATSGPSCSPARTVKVFLTASDEERARRRQRDEAAVGAVGRGRRRCKAALERRDALDQRPGRVAAAAGRRRDSGRHDRPRHRRRRRRARRTGACRGDRLMLLLPAGSAARHGDPAPAVSACPIVGEQHLPSDGRVHPGAVAPVDDGHPVRTARVTPPAVRFMGKASLFRIPVLGAFFRGSAAFPSPTTAPTARRCGFGRRCSRRARCSACIPRGPARTAPRSSRCNPARRTLRCGRCADRPGGDCGHRGDPAARTAPIPAVRARVAMVIGCADPVRALRRRAWCPATRSTRSRPGSPTSCRGCSTTRTSCATAVEPLVGQIAVGRCSRAVVEAGEHLRRVEVRSPANGRRARGPRRGRRRTPTRPTVSSAGTSSRAPAAGGSTRLLR